MKFLSKLFGSKKAGSVTSIDIVAAYGAVLENEPYGFGGTIAEATLPYPKAVIKSAILDVAAAHHASDEMLNILKAGFMQLAVFHPDGGGSSVIFDNSKTPSSREEVVEAAKKWSTASPELGRMDAVTVEMSGLMKEWDDHLLKLGASK